MIKMNDEEYEKTRQRHFRAQAIKYVMKLFDASALRKERAIELPDQPGTTYAFNNGWICRLGDTGKCWLTDKGTTVGVELASEREDWYLMMSDWIGDE